MVAMIVLCVFDAQEICMCTECEKFWDMSCFWWCPRIFGPHSFALMCEK